MKKIIFILLTIAIIILPTAVSAQEETEEPTAAPSTNQIPESDEEIERVQRIKDIVASKVAELNLVEKRGIIASVVEVSSTEIRGIDNKGNEITIDVDELTNFDFDDEDFGISDLTTGEIYSFIGLYNKDSETLLARFIAEADSIPDYIGGAITSINEDDFQVEVVDKNGKTTIIDIESSTDTMLVDENGALEESGFSGLSVNQRIIVVGFETDDEIVSATRVIHFADIPPSSEVLANLKTETTTATGSSNTVEILEVEEE